MHSFFLFPTNLYRYRRNEKFTWHLDALSPAESAPEVGGQRTATLLVYLTELAAGDGGSTVFRDLQVPATENRDCEEEDALRLKV